METIAKPADDDNDDRPQKRELRRRVAVKFIDSFELPYQAGAENSFPVEWKAGWKKISARFPGATLKPVFTAVSPERLKELVALAVKRDPTYRPPNFLTFFAIDVPSLRQAKNLVKNLTTSWTIVEQAYVESLPLLPATSLPQHYIENPTSPFTTAQPNNGNQIQDIGGIGVEYAWDQAGGSGIGVSFVDIEKGWSLNHPDLVDGNGQPKIPVPLGGSFNYGIQTATQSANGFDYSETQHGTRVLGVLAANPNDQAHNGWKGIAYGATGHVVSPWGGTAPVPRASDITGKLDQLATPNQQPEIWSIPNAILTAIDHLDFGDVILLEVQAEFPSDSESYWPVEIEDMNFQMIRLAAALGIVVVEAAGNGSNKIDSLITKDSGAIIVGAAIPTTATAVADPGIQSAPVGSRSLTSNYGARVDCFAWGDTVFSLDIELGTGNNSSGNPAEPCYTGIFAGTSAATAIVAGAAIVLQGIAQTALSSPVVNFRFSAFQMRNILRDRSTSAINNLSINTPSANPDVDQIGVMPNLERILKNTLNIVADVVIRDNLADKGDPHFPLAEESPDIIVRPAGETQNPQAQFGTNASMQQSNLSSTVEAGIPYDIFVRVFNRGRVNAEDVQATVYWTEPATSLHRPDLWRKLGSSGVATVQPGLTSMQVLPGIKWPKDEITPPASGIHPVSFIATVGCTSDPDPIPDPADLVNSLTSEQLFRLSSTNNNIATRNLHVIPLPADDSGVILLAPAALDVPSPTLTLDFLAPGAYGAALKMGLDVTAHLPTGSLLWLEGPKDFMDALNSGQFNPGSPGKVQQLISSFGTTPFQSFVFPAKSLTPLRLSVFVPRDQRQSTYEIYVRHLYQNTEISRITWQLVPEPQAGTPSGLN